MTNAKITQQAQVDKFREAARELQTDDSEKSFDAIVKKIAKPPAKDDKDGPQSGRRGNG
jgi:hypothetical protein